MIGSYLTGAQFLAFSVFRFPWFRWEAVSS